LASQLGDSLDADDCTDTPSFTPTPYPAASRALPVAIPGYEVLGIIGRGGMGVVYRARHLDLNREIALKVLAAGTHAHPALLARFRLEAQSLAGLQHPNIVQIHEVGETNGIPYCALEYIAGGSLAQSLKAGSLPPADAARLVEVLARAMQYAHERGVVHRDLKPANILLAPNPKSEIRNPKPIQRAKDDKPKAPGEVSDFGFRISDFEPKITDFGLAKRVQGGAGLTQTGEILGTPSYMAPEQAGGVVKQVGPLADIYALGAILYELLTGRPPFRAQDPVETILKVLSEYPVPPRRLQPKVPRDLETICLKCLEKDQDRRYASARDLADDLQRFLAHETIHARPAGPLGRAVKWARRRPVRAGFLGAGILLAMVAALGILWYWDAHLRTKIEYYNTYVDHSGAPEGVGRLTEEQARHRYVTYKFYRRGGRVEKVEVVNGHGVLTGDHPTVAYLSRSKDADAEKRECRFDFQRNEKGEVTEQVASDRAGNVVWEFHFTRNDTAHYTDRHGFPRARTGSGAAYVEFVRSAAGFVTEVRYLDSRGRPQPNQNGVYGARRKVDDRGLVVEQTAFGADGQPALLADAYATVKRAHDDLGNVLTEAYFDRAGNPTRHKDGFARLSYRYDEYGNTVEIAAWGLDGRPALYKRGFARVTQKFGPQGDPVEQAYFGRSGKPALCDRGFARMEWVCDAQGNRVAESYFDWAGRPTAELNGYAKTTAEYNARGNPTAVAFFDVRGRPTLHREGYARIGWTYDRRGNWVEEAYFDLRGRLARPRDGISRTTAAYDDHGNRIAEAYFDPSGKPSLSKDGFARLAAVFDERGNRTEVAYFGTDGKPALRREGFHRMTKVYDAHGNPIEEAYFGTDGRPILHHDGMALIRREYHANGRCLRESYFGCDGKPVLDRDGIAGMAYTYDRRGNQTAYANFGLDGKPALHRNGFHKIAWVYDARDNAVEESYWDRAGRLVPHRQGMAKIRRVYDPMGRLIGEKYFDVAGRHIRGAYDFAEFRTRLDPCGRRIETRYFGPDGKPTLSQGGIARIAMSYDARGNKIEEANYGLCGEPKLNWHGVARTRLVYDLHGNQVAEYYLDASGKPMRCIHNVARWVATHDNRGNVLTTRYFGLDGRPTFHVNGYALVKRGYDSRGNKTSEAYYDASGKRIPSRRSGYARASWTYDNRGVRVDAAYWDAGGRPLRPRVVITSVEPRSPARAAGLRAGDILEDFAGKPVSNAARFMQARSGERQNISHWQVAIRRKGRRFVLSLPPGWFERVTMEDRVPREPERIDPGGWLEMVLKFLFEPSKTSVGGTP
jgi:YD repeat-containing protein